MRRRQADHRAQTSGQKRVGCGGHRCSRGDHVVHEEHRTCPRPPACRGSHQKTRTGPSLGVGTPGLRWAGQPSQQPRTWQPEAGGQSSSQHLRLIETTGAATHRGGRRPGDCACRIACVDQGRHALGEPDERAAGVAVLEASHQLAGRTLVRQQRPACGQAGRQRDRWRATHQRHARLTGRGTSAVTTGTRRRHQHAREPTQRV